MRESYKKMANTGLNKHCAYHVGRFVFIVTVLACSIGLRAAEQSDNEKLLYGAMVRDIVMMKSALHAGADPNHAPAGKRSPLWVAATDQNPEAVELLLKNGGDPNQLDHQGTPLLIAASRVINASRDNSAQVVDLLLRSGADIEAMDKKKRYRPLTMAATFGTYATIKTLLDNGAKPNNVPDNGFPALFMLSKNKHCKLDCLELLLAHGADPDLQYRKGTSTYRESTVRSADRAKIELIEKYFPVKK